MSQVKKVVLAYSGGLDTSIIIPWIKENYGGAEIVAYCGDVGQGDDLEAVRRKALATGASKCVVEDLREEFVRDYAYAALAAGAVYEDNYLLGTALARPLLAYRQVQTALNEGRGSFAPKSDPVLAVDGIYGEHTAAAVRGTQQLAHIPADGVVGLQTWAIPVHAAGQVLADLCGVTGPGGG